VPPPSLPDLAPLAGLLVLLELAVGTVTVSAALDQAGRVGRGFAGTTAAICVLLMGADLLLISGASDIGALLHRTVDAGTVATFIHLAVAFTVLLVVDAIFAAVGTEVSRRVVAAATIAVGLACVVAAAAAIGPALGGTATALFAFGGCSKRTQAISSPPASAPGARAPASARATRSSGSNRQGS